MKDWRQRLFIILERSEERTRIGRIYEVAMMLLIIISIIPLMFRESHPYFRVIEIVTVSVFIVDYLLRWITAVSALR